MTMRFAAYALAVVVAVCAVLVARKRAEHRALAAWACVAPFIGLLRASLPLVEPHWILRSMTLLGPCSVAALALYIIGGIRPWPALAAWLVLSGAAADVQAVSNPAGIYRAAHLSVLAAGFAALLARHPFGSSNDGKADEMDSKALDVTSLCTYALIAQWGVGDIVAAYLHSDPWAEHRFVQRLAIFVSVALIALQGGWLWRRRTRSSVAR